MKSIGWIGVGIMGKPMVRNLQKAGYTLHIYARNREKVADVIQEGAIFHDTIGDCAQGRDAVITMVGFPKDVEEVYFAPGNILDRADPGTYLIDMTTTSPALAQRIFQQGRQPGPAGFGCPGDRRGHRGPGRAPSPFWWAGRRRTTRPAGPCWRPWGPTSATRAPQAADSMPNWPTKS